MSLISAQPDVSVEEITETVLELDNLNVHYGDYHAVRDVSMAIPARRVTALIGPSGCGKSTVLRTFNRMNDAISGARISGDVTYHGVDIYARDIDPIMVRRKIGMVFQKPNPFPKSIYDNIAYGPRVIGMPEAKKRADLDQLVEKALRDAALWEEVKDKLKSNALSLSGGQQQRLCIARAIAVEPDVILMDEPCSALDPIATARIEELMADLVRDYTIVIVTHNMGQARRVSHNTAFLTADVDEDGVRFGQLVEYGPTARLFDSPREQRTADYLAGRFG